MTKKILLPTDFSENANNAFTFALELCRKLHAQLILLHAYQAPSSTGMFISVESYMREDAQSDMLPFINKAAEVIHRQNVESIIVKMDPISAITSVAINKEVDMIVMGTQGANSLVDIFLGTNTVGVMSKTDIPLLAIPNEFSFRPIKEITLAVDQEAVSYAKILAPIFSISRAFDAHVRIYHQDVGVGDSGIDPSLDIYFESISRSYHYELDANNISQSINDLDRKSVV